MLFRGQAEAFTAGNDLEDFMQRPAGRGRDTPVFRFLRADERARASRSVAAVNGSGGGPRHDAAAAIATWCTRATTRASRCPSRGSAWCRSSPRLSTCCRSWPAIQRAAELLLLAKPSTPPRPTTPLRNPVLPADEVLPAAWKAAERLASLPATSIETSKALLKKAHADAIAAQLAEESGHFHRMLREPAAREAFEAFFQKRKPDFKGKIP